MLLDHQAAAFGLLHADNGLVHGLVPGLFGRGAVAVVVQLALEQAEQGAVVVLGITHQQVQVRIRDAGDQLGAVEGQAVGVVGVEYHQDAADGLHGRGAPGRAEGDLIQL